MTFLLLFEVLELASEVWAKASVLAREAQIDLRSAQRDFVVGWRQESQAPD
jgi:hypothetical protein